MADTKRLDFVQAMRGIAALMVVLCHARWFLVGTPQQDFAEWLLYCGSAGVDIFFVISGFVMVYSTRNSDGSLFYSVEFLVKRFAKIWVPYAVIGLISFYYLHGSRTFDSANIAWMAKSLLFIPPDVNDFFYLGSGLTPVAWSLNYEFYFYLIFAGSLLFGKFRWLALFGWMFVFVYLIPVHDRGFFSVLPFSRIESNAAYLQMMTNPIILEFLAGVVLGFVYLSPLKIRSATLCRLACFYAISACAWAWMAHFRPVNSIGYFGIFAVAVMFCFSIASKTIPMHVPRVLVWLGGISYSLYLVHPMVNAFLDRQFIAHGMQDVTHSWAHVVITTATSIVVAAVSNYALERMAHDLVRDKLLSILHPWQRKSQPAPLASRN
ncbi:acyltransferase [Caballeronia novacaledonica]|uniref:Acyltransferase n=1 Tax=Caballeronia novacaledonica TaxID=1544861 RepID=A0AA37IGR6_9BURK|nr:acyltransferase [Caballeronia novacaledonica]GJH26015.1 acyltransferase [Caballeronia novacaledonica]